MEFETAKKEEVPSAAQKKTQEERLEEALSPIMAHEALAESHSRRLHDALVADSRPGTLMRADSVAAGSGSVVGEKFRPLSRVVLNQRSRGLLIYP